MGCGISKSTTPKVYRHIKINHFSNKTKGNRKEYKNFISQNNWLNILDFLNYAEIKEVGKTNKLFNYLVKQNQILIKFFKKKNDSAIDYQQHPKNNKGVNIIYSKKIFESFSFLQKAAKRNNSILSEYSTSSEEKCYLYYKKI